MGRILVTGMVATALMAAPSETSIPKDDITRNRPIDQEQRNQALNELEGRPAPRLEAEDWANTDPLDWEQLRGNVVLLDFWGVWCKPCVNAIPKLRELNDAHQDEGLVVIGVHTQESMRRGKQFVREQSIEYPVVFDKGDAIAERYRISHYPSYYLVDRQGRLRMADVFEADIEAAVEFLLEEERVEK